MVSSKSTSSTQDHLALGTGANGSSNMRPPNTSRPGQSAVFARLQALFPPSASASPTTDQPVFADTSQQHESVSSSAEKQPPFLKIRVVTWNMHDSLPKGELDDLLGLVPLTDPATRSSEPNSKLPVLPNKAGHPYHLIVVAGQECPSASGIPMALGAGLRRKEKERNKDRDKLKGVDKDNTPDNGDAESLQQQHEDENDEPKLSARNSGTFLAPVQHTDDHACEGVPKPSSETDRSPHDAPGHHAQSGWSSVLEEWYGSASIRGDSPDVLSKSPLPNTPLSPSMELENQQSHRAGPYELLQKDRMMGVYLAIYIRRDIKHLVRGISKSSVTAGLMGGRVGNKGGVGISLNLDGTTLLFVNAHLAAHGNRIGQRLSDWAKIKAFLTVDDFLPSSDPRVMAEDLTDKFDYTFLLGDLNFRLEITRLHADWLISRKEYAQALAFDQLRKLMVPGGAFAGFEEGPIDFPPTFKYDVVRSNKFPKRAKSKRQHQPSGEASPDTNPRDAVQDDENGDFEHEHEFDSASMISSMMTSAHSRLTLDDHTMHDEDEEGISTSPHKNSDIHSIVHKVRTVAAAHKAKAKWISFLSASIPGTPSHKRMKRNSHSESLSAKLSVRDPHLHADAEPSPGSVEVHPEADEEIICRGFSARGDSPLDNQASMTNLERDEILEPEEKGVYDSSPKQRVPSWCDRILWKTTVIQEPEPEAEKIQNISSRSRIAHVFQSLRPHSLRSRKDSQGSAFSFDTNRLSIDQAARMSHEQHRSRESSQLVGTSQRPHSPPRLHLKPIDSLSNLMKPVLSRTISHTLSVVDDQGGSHIRAPTDSVPMRHTKTFDPTLINRGLPMTESITSTSHEPLSDVVSTESSQGFFGPPRWLGFLPFLHRDSTMHSTDASETLPVPEPQPPPPRKGDVVCLEYRTLDDRAMRKLGGRSDHRPVIGSYAVYI